MKQAYTIEVDIKGAQAHIKILCPIPGDGVIIYASQVGHITLNLPDGDDEDFSREAENLGGVLLTLIFDAYNAVMK